MNESLPSGRAPDRAFTLVEMLVVITIVLILITLIIPAVSGLVRSYDLGSSTQGLVSQLTLARQTALSRGNPVQVRLYLLPASGADAASTPTTYRAIQCFTENDPVVNAAAGNGGTATTASPLTAITKPFIFSKNVVVLGDVQRSTLLPAAATKPAATDSAVSVYGTNYQYTAFRFKPSSGTDLSSGANTLTLVTQTDKIAANGFPNNFRTIKIDPLNGTVETYEP